MPVPNSSSIIRCIFGSELQTKLRRIVTYLHGSYPFTSETLDYTEYWDQLSQGEEWQIVAPSKLRFMEGLVDEGSSMLDIGCGDGSLLYHLSRTRNIRGEGGVDLVEDGGLHQEVDKAVEGWWRGLSG